MAPILQDLSAANLAIAIEANLISWMSLFRRAWEVKEDDPPGLKRSISPIPSPLFNSIMDAHLDLEIVDTTIEHIKADAHTREVSVLWWVGPSTLPGNLDECLVANGFTIDGDSPGMAVDLSRLNGDLPKLEGLTISEAQDDNGLRAWCLAMIQGFEAPAGLVDFIAGYWYDFLHPVYNHVVKIYLARLEGKPVATSLLQLGAGVAGIYSVATLPEARRKGIGAQVTLAPLVEARRMGYKAGVLAASEMGYPIYRSLGFQDYCRITSFVYRPKKE